MLKQLLLITDGCSNTGVNPVVAAAHAAESGITVNVIGVVEQGEIGRNGALEAEAIAQAGGGMCRIVSIRDVAQTVQMMTRKTVTQTIQQAVEKELKRTFAVDSVEQLSPVKRAHVVKVMDDLGESVSLRVCLLIDTSASMKPKLHSLEEAIRDLSLSLEARSGKSEISVMYFPAEGDRDAGIALPWTSHAADMRSVLSTLTLQGVTPTGPAMMCAIPYVNGESALEDDGAEEDQALQRRETGLLQDYVV